MSKVVLGDCQFVLKDLEENSIDLVCTDPPYGYSFMGKDWDKAVPSVEIWRECLRVLKPGAFAFVMSAPRQDVLSQMIVRLGEAGFETGFTSIYWTYASGFPKAMNIGKMVDKRGAVHPDELRAFKTWYKTALDSCGKTYKEINEACGFTATSYSKTDGKDYWTSAFPTTEKWPIIKRILGCGEEWDSLLERYAEKRGYLDEPTGGLATSDTTPFTGKQLKPESWSPEAKALDGSYGGFQPKPAVEIIIVAMKPLSEKTYVDQALKNGKGVTWLDDARVPYNGEVPNMGGRANAKMGGDQPYGFKVEGRPEEANTLGRFPANLCVSDSVLDGTSRFFSLDQWFKSACDTWPTLRAELNQGAPPGSEVVHNSGYTVPVDALSRLYRSLDRLSGSALLGSSFETYPPTSEDGCARSLRALQDFLGGYLSDYHSSDERARLAEDNDPELLRRLDDAHRLLLTAWPKDGLDGIAADNASSYCFFLACYLAPTMVGEEARSFNVDELPEHVRKVFPFLIVPKASKREKNEGLEGFEAKLPAAAEFRPNHTEKALAGEDGNPYGRWGTVKNTHATVKPLALMSYLITLGSRPGDTVLDPFLGSGTTACAAKALGRKYIGIEREKEYADIALARVNAIEGEKITLTEFSSEPAKINKPAERPQEIAVEMDYNSLIEKELNGTKLTREEIAFLNKLSTPHYPENLL